MMNILVTLNANYIPPLKVMLHSLFINNPDESFSIYLFHSSLTEKELHPLHDFIKKYGHSFHPIYLDSEHFKEAPVFRHYTSEMYYRLAAHQFLPTSVERILYLDPDIVNINRISKFYYSDFEDSLFMAAEHAHTTKLVQPINKIRLKTPFARGYYNTGVMVMNISLMRKLVHLADIYSFIEENKLKLILPDQDVLNALYWDKIKPLDEFRYNYDARYFELTKFYPTYKNNIDWITTNTLFIHYCGKDKPWQDDYKGELGIFYKKYEKELNHIDKIPKS